MIYIYIHTYIYIYNICLFENEGCVPKCSMNMTRSPSWKIMGIWRTWRYSIIYQWHEDINLSWLFGCHNQWHVDTADFGRKITIHDFTMDQNHPKPKIVLQKHLRITSTRYALQTSFTVNSHVWLTKYIFLHTTVNWTVHRFFWQHFRVFHKKQNRRPPKSLSEQVKRSIENLRKQLKAKDPAGV